MDFQSIYSKLQNNGVKPFNRAIAIAITFTINIQVANEDKWKKLEARRY